MIRRAHAKLFDALAPWTTGRLLPFVYGEHAPAEVAESVHPGGRPAAKLRELKRRHDPREHLPTGTMKHRRRQLKR